MYLKGLFICYGGHVGVFAIPRAVWDLIRPQVPLDIAGRGFECLQSPVIRGTIIQLSQQRPSLPRFAKVHGFSPHSHGWFGLSVIFKM
jgi:hypothetical protein